MPAVGLCFVRLWPGIGIQQGKEDMKHSGRSGVARLFELAGTKKPHLIAAALLSIIASACALAPYGVIYLVLVRLLAPDFGPGGVKDIQSLALVAVGLVVLRCLTLFASTMCSHVAAFDILYNLRCALTAHLGKLPMGYFSARQTGQIKKILYEDVEELEGFIAHHIPDLVSGAVLPVLIVGVLFLVDWRLALVALLPLPLAFFLQRRVFARDGLGQRRARYHDALEAMNATIVEYVRGMPVIKIFNQTVSSFARLKDAALAYRRYIEEITRCMAPSWAMFVVVTSSGLLFLLPFGLWLYLDGEISLPTLLLFLMLGSSYMTPLFRLALLGGQLGHLLEGLARVDAILATPPLAEPAKPQLPRSAAVEFDRVTFGYGQQPVLRELSLRLAPGSVTALVGPSGAGKSTIAQLLLRMWDVDAGAIRIGGVDVRDMAPEALMRQVGFVFQDGFLFSDTLRENIRMGCEGATEADIERAARAAQCEEFVRRLPRGFDTRVGEGGEVHLSGGEKQRVSMARIMLKNAPIVVLDEATAYADAENEARMQDAFAALMQGKTVLVIAHRLSTITDADAVVVVKDGVVAEQGRHEELLAQRGVYHAMWQAHTAARDWTLQVKEN
jgi:ATP-binding cassette subfamily B protein